MRHRLLKGWKSWCVDTMYVHQYKKLRSSIWVDTSVYQKLNISYTNRVIPLIVFIMATIRGTARFVDHLNR